MQGLWSSLIAPGIAAISFAWVGEVASTPPREDGSSIDLGVSRQNPRMAGMDGACFLRMIWTNYTFSLPGFELKLGAPCSKIPH